MLPGQTPSMASGMSRPALILVTIALLGAWRPCPAQQPLPAPVTMAPNPLAPLLEGTIVGSHGPVLSGPWPLPRNSAVQQGRPEPLANVHAAWGERRR